MGGNTLLSPGLASFEHSTMMAAKVVCSMQACHLVPCVVCPVCSLAACIGCTHGPVDCNGFLPDRLGFRVPANPSDALTNITATIAKSCLWVHLETHSWLPCSCEPNNLFPDAYVSSPACGSSVLYDLLPINKWTNLSPKNKL